MNRLPDLIQPLIHRVLGAHQGALAHIHGIGQDFAALANPIRIRAVLDFDTFGFQEAF